jgi:hypothetical protein
MSFIYAKSENNPNSAKFCFTGMYQLQAYQHCPGFDNSILRHRGIWETADEAVLNIIYKKKKIQKILSITPSLILNAMTTVFVGRVPVGGYGFRSTEGCLYCSGMGRLGPIKKQSLLHIFRIEWNELYSYLLKGLRQQARDNVWIITGKKTSCFLIKMRWAMCIIVTFHIFTVNTACKSLFFTLIFKSCL